MYVQQFFLLSSLFGRKKTKDNSSLETGLEELQPPLTNPPPSLSHTQTTAHTQREISYM